MDLLSGSDFRSLIERRNGPCVSMFMPTHQAGGGTLQDPIRLKNLLSDAEGHLVDLNMRRPDAENLLESARRLVDDTEFWLYQASGLAVFLCKDFFRSYRVPLDFGELVVVADRFHVKPLMPLLTGDGHFFVLALSGGDVRFLEGTRYTIAAVELPPDAPKNLAEALKYDDPESQLQFHTGTQDRPGKRAAMFHGHGVGIDDTKDSILRYCREVDRVLGELLKEERAPLVLAAVDYIHPLFREATSYRYLLEEGITGNPEELSSKELHSRAWSVVEPHFNRAREDARARYHELAESGKTSSQVASALIWAHRGRVDSVFVPLGVHCWGEFIADDEHVVVHEEREAGDEDLLDVIAVQTFLRGGIVYAVPPEDIPGDGPVAAIFRY